MTHKYLFTEHTVCPLKVLNAQDGKPFARNAPFNGLLPFTKPSLTRYHSKITVYIFASTFVEESCTVQLCNPNVFSNTYCTAGSVARMN